VTEREIRTRKGIECRVREAGDGPAVLFLHGAGGLLAEEPLLDRLAERFRVLAPVWPGYGDDAGEDLLEDMLDFTLHGWDVADALDLDRTRLLGHSMGGMIAAEMACLSPERVERLGLLAPTGIWIDEHPIHDVFATTPFDLPALLFSDAALGARVLTAGTDFSNMEALQTFLVGNARRLGTAGKILFPIPNRRLSKRLYRLTAKTALVWGEDDRLIPPVYASRWKDLIADATVTTIPGAGHMLSHERIGEVAAALEEHFGS